MFRFVGGTALITGAASGIGLGMARAFGEAGMKIAMVDIDEAVLAASAAELEKLGITVLPIKLDVSDYAAWTDVAAQVLDKLGPIRVLCNNAGVGANGMPIATLDPAVWNRFMAINLDGVFYGTHACLPQMKAAGGGHIINTASMAGVLPGTPGVGAYGVTKHGVVCLSEVLRAELAADSIGVSVLLPGSVRTALWRTSRSAQGRPDIDTPPPENLRGSANPDGLDPYRVGQYTLKAMEEGEFYIITAPELRPVVSRRFQGVEQAFDNAEKAEPYLKGASEPAA